ncbi:MAG: hypothetical protein AAF720_04145 [Pseudomonadota bacterium]
MIKQLKRVSALIVGMAIMVATAFATTGDVPPMDAESQAISYVESRLENPRGARVRTDGGPYKIYADFDGYDQVPAWAVDVRARMRLRSGSGSAPYTVIFVDGEPVAIASDGVDISMR